VFLIEDKRHGATFLVFTSEDPRKDGYTGSVAEGVSLEYDIIAVHSWLDGEEAPEACVGRAAEDPKHYKVFKYARDRQTAGYLPVAGTAVVFRSWNDYLKLNPDPEYLQKADAEEWYERLDEYDEASRRRRQRVQQPALPAGKSREEVAAWVARKHLIADSGIREVWYLPQGAPSDEIRLLELNDRLAGNGSRTEAIDFALDIEGASFRLFIADITSEQLDEIKHDPSRLPPGWSLSETRVWRRGA
jgi:hypothetical protein